MNTHIHKHLRGLGIGAITSLVLLTGCANLPETSETYAEAQQAVERAQETPGVTQYAALKLQQAQESLDQAEELWEEYGDDRMELVEHNAYLAKQQALTAIERAELGEAREQMTQVSEAREDVLREARQRELLTAQQRAEELRQTVQDLEAQQTERGMVLTLDEVVFDFGEANLKPGGERAMERLASFLEENPDRQVLVEGYTDAVGSEDFNMQLSRERAEAVRQQLVTAGIDPERIEVQAHGENYPIASNETTAGRQLNRRVEVVIGEQGNGSPEPRTASPEQEQTAEPGAQQQEQQGQQQQ